MNDMKVRLVEESPYDRTERGRAEPAEGLAKKVKDKESRGLGRTFIGIAMIAAVCIVLFLALCYGVVYVVSSAWHAGS
jgi:hypothetical protein